MPETILITGCAGLLGTHLSEYFLSKGYSVVGLDNLSGGYRDFIPQGVFFYETDLNVNNIENIFDYHKPKYVIHAAAFAAVCLSPYVRKFNYTTNLVGYSNVVNSCLKFGVEKILVFSSMDVYGNQSPPFTEDLLPKPEDPYGIAKYAMEMDIKSAHHQFGIKYSICRPHNIIGTKQNIWDRYRNVIGIWIRKVLNGEDITVYGDGEQKRAFSDVAFYMEPVEKMLLSDDCETYNIGADKPISIIAAARLLQKIAKKHGYHSNIVHLEPRNEVKYAWCDHSKAKKDLNFKDETNLKKTFEEMFLWAKNQPVREVKTMKYEIEEELYSYWK